MIETRLLPRKELWCDRPNRYRQGTLSPEHISTLASSIKENGLLQPLVVTNEASPDGEGKYKILAGECRYKATGQLGWDEVPCVFLKDLPDTKARQVELEENLKRKDMDWHERCKGVLHYHELCQEDDSEWTGADTGRALSMSGENARDMIAIGLEIREGDPRIAGASTFTAARKILYRKRERSQEAEDARLASTVKSSTTRLRRTGEGDDDFELEIDMPAADEAEDEEEDKRGHRPAYKDIHTADFLEFLKEFKGQRFNLLHCDFPYGISLDQSPQAGTKHWEGYADNEDLFWLLCNELVKHQDKILLPNAHIVFWCATRMLPEVVDFFTRHTNWRINHEPLIWHKTDGRGVVRDSARGPRHCYETALLMTRGDRKIVQVVNNLYGCPVRKEIHQSEKPEPMLRHFFRMLVDEYTELLDPTCGSASALRAAESLGAERVIGLDLSEENVEMARNELDDARRKRALQEQSE